MKISVALCTYNGEKFLSAQLDSILRQTVAVDEIWVFDDASTDHTAEILERFRLQHPALFRVHINSSNIGFVKNFEQALLRCTGDIIFLCDQDDLWHEDKIEKMLGFFQAHPQIWVAAHDLALLNHHKAGKTFWELKHYSRGAERLNQHELLHRVLISGNIFPGMSLALRRNAVINYLPLAKPDPILIHDYEIVVKALRDETFGATAQILGSYRLHEEQAIGAREKPTVLTSELKAIQQKSEHYVRLCTYTRIFGLPRSLATSYRRGVRKKYRNFLRRFPWPRRLFIHLKNKYYYKILHF